ncbi:MAG: hypothetical protein IAE88_17820 [Rhodobacteraceae bacterium]|uniref:hypothetical protein n=1 Tax=Accumulibacter sp. TaxID=2053492 RepID=UPI0019E0603C|nr:hypothetical protein [Accumulibacter sp.]MBE2260720.1 hypothetical protein [Paracoccaceae bacterium]MCB1941555.1 hypothetical protein [Accumulibacter sp.]
MYIVDDPTLALIARFVGDSARQDVSDAEFFRRQYAAIEEYVERFPPEQRDQRALAWIEANAMRYRQQWQKGAVVEVLANRRCPDCPLAGGSQRKPCAIHTRWLKLLQRYAADQLSSHDYVAKSLALLAAHKDGLKVSECRAQSCSTPLPAPCAS